MEHMKEKVVNQLAALSKSRQPVYRICLTGGACAGKTTALDKFNEVFSKKGYNVLTVPEAATMFMTSGAFINCHDMKLSDAVRLQINIMRT